MTEQVHYATYLRQKIKGLMAQTTLTRADVWELEDAAFLADDCGGSELTALVGPDLVNAASNRAWAWRQAHPWEGSR